MGGIADHGWNSRPGVEQRDRWVGYPNGSIFPHEMGVELLSGRYPPMGGLFYPWVITIHQRNATYTMQQGLGWHVRRDPSKDSIIHFVW